MNIKRTTLFTQRTKMPLHKSALAIAILVASHAYAVYYIGKEVGIEEGEKKALQVLKGTSIPCEVVEYRNTGKRLTVVRAGYVALDKEISTTDKVIMKDNEIR